MQEDICRLKTSVGLKRCKKISLKEDVCLLYKQMQEDVCRHLCKMTSVRVIKKIQEDVCRHLCKALNYLFASLAWHFETLEHTTHTQPHLVFWLIVYRYQILDNRQTFLPTTKTLHFLRK